MGTDGGRGNAWQRGGGGSYQPRGYRVGKPASYRHRSLVLNGSGQTGRPDAESASASDASTSSWVTKTDRHLQLISSSVYEKDAQARSKAIEETRRRKRQQRDSQERSKLFNHFSHVANGGGAGAANGTAASRYEVVLDGVRFYVTKNGSKLVKVPGWSTRPPSVPERSTHSRQDDLNPAGATPKTAVVGGVKFYRSKNGNLYRHGIVKAQRYVSRTPGGRPLILPFDSHSGAVKKINQPCKIFSTTGTSLSRRSILFYSARGSTDHGKGVADIVDFVTGSCSHGPRCRYIHDASKVAVCKDALQKGHCSDGDLCDLSHDLTPERTPHCLHFAKGNCTNPSCRYAHVQVSPGSLVCRPFGIYGYCEKGAGCSERHAIECPDFSNTGTCKNKKCKLLHRERASVLRKATAERDSKPETEMADLSSDDESESADSDDVDSDEVEEFIGEEEGPDLDFATQKDFIEL